MAIKTDPLFKYLKGHYRTYFQWEHVFGVPIKEQLKEVGGPPIGTTKAGKIVINNIRKVKSTQKRSLGSCWRVTLARIRSAWKRAYGKDIFAGKSAQELKLIDRLAGTRSRFPLWKKVPHKLRRKGVPGVLAYLKLAKIIEGPKVWTDLDSGSPLQLWPPIHPLGHSAIMYRYIKNKNGKNVGMVIADQCVDFWILKNTGQKRSIIGAKYLKRS